MGTPASPGVPGKSASPASLQVPEKRLEAVRFAVGEVFEVVVRVRRGGGGAGARFTVPDEDWRMLSIDLVENADTVRRVLGLG